MKEFEVTITETLQKSITVEAATKEEAQAMVEEMWDKGDVVLDADHFVGAEFSCIGKFENEVTQLTEPTEQEIRQMREEIEEAKKEKSRAYHRQYSREYRARNLEKQREYDRIKAREYRARRKAQTAAAQPAQ